MGFQRALTLFLGIACISLDAAPAPSGGVIERQIQKEYEGNPQEAPRKSPDIQIDTSEESLVMPEGLKVYVDRIELRGNEKISSKEICDRLDSKIHKPLSLKDIHRLCRMIESFYNDRGILQTKAYPPQQKIKDGVLILKIREASKSERQRTEHSEN